MLKSVFHSPFKNSLDLSDVDGCIISNHQWLVLFVLTLIFLVHLVILLYIVEVGLGFLCLVILYNFNCDLTESVALR